ncbi:glycoside hydrolase family 95 protein [Trametopsis cervina]|nr:glycoside hydrolase family 95 protein [Trametopsis cervina]
MSIIAAVVQLAITAAASAVPLGFPASGNGIWYASPGESESWVKEWLPIGNGYLAAMTPGGTTYETTQLNIESLWSGGPFMDASYNGGNKYPSQREEMTNDMCTIRQTIFASGTTDSKLLLIHSKTVYLSSYAGSGYLITSLATPDASPITEYSRWLDLDQALAQATWNQDNTTFMRVSLCSSETQACSQYLTSSGSDISPLPPITFAFSSSIESGLPSAAVTCFDNSTLLVQGNVAVPGMKYELLFRSTATGEDARSTCNSLGTQNATLAVTDATEAWITWVGGTEYSLDAGDEPHNFSFAKPLSETHASLVGLLDTATASDTTFDQILLAHVSSYQKNLGDLRLTFGANENINITGLKPTDELKAQYQIDEGDPYIEWLLFNFGRYLLASSAPGTLPANLQGKWAADTAPPWSADSNINIQMNYWFAEMTGMPSNVVTPLFDYIEKTWAPRGTETAQVLYNISRGWVTHNEIFGHTGMKLSGNSAQWADYPESNAWMMVHVWDHFDYTQDTAWWRAQGWPLLKGVASFHLDKLIQDEYFNDSTLVVAPCNSPEQVPITFGCAHAQQLIWQLFNAVEKGWDASGDTDMSFLEEVRTKRAQMDKGIHIGSWGQLQEWKLDMDSPTDTHRHLSHLIGLYPGYALSSYSPSLQGPPASSKSDTYSKAAVLEATKTSLIHRGNGTAPDGDAGWEKVWRAAAWAQFADAKSYNHQLTYAVEHNFAGNLFSLYDPSDTSLIFQIDANLGYPAAVLNALVQAPDVASETSPLVVTVLPAVPQRWESGSLRNVHLRGGLVLNMDWEKGQPTALNLSLDRGHTSRQINVVFKEANATLTLGVGQSRNVTFSS